MILGKLNALEDAPWGDLRGKELDSRGLASRLRKFDIHPKDVRLGEDVRKGYKAEDLADSWPRYLQSQSATSATQSASSATSAADSTPDVADVADVADKSGDAPAQTDLFVADVTDKREESSKGFPSVEVGNTRHPTQALQALQAKSNRTTCTNCDGPLVGSVQMAKQRCGPCLLQRTA